MKNRWSFLAVVLIAIALLTFRFSYPREEGVPLKVTTYDAFGYYMYNPSIFIYGDINELKWVPKVETQYQVTGGDFYQATQLESGNYTNKYLGGVAIMQMPFFFAGHVIASTTDYPADGFSAPYQWSIAFAALFYCLLGLILLRIVLLRYFKDGAVAITLLFLGLGTNLLQYSAIEGGQSHIYIFPLYALVIWATIKWHEAPNWRWAALIGFTIGLATISRPTELIMLFIPLLWNTQEKEVRKRKWQLVRQHLPHLAFVIGFGLLGVFPQLIYWKMTADTFIYDVGSKWFFFNPWFRVLFGVNNGFFIYTPITILFVVGFFLLKKYPFQRSVLTFCLLNIWIITAWSDWRYGATFSTRAMVQSYPVFAFAMAASVTFILKRKILRLVVLNLGAFLLYANIFQMTQYNTMVLHYHDMNWAYYTRIYLNPTPTPLDFSLLDTDHFVRDENSYKKVIIEELREVGFGRTDSEPYTIINVLLQEPTEYVKLEVDVRADVGLHANMLQAQIGAKKLSKVRLKRPLIDEGKYNSYAFYARIPKDRKSNFLSLTVSGWENFSGYVKNVKVTQLKP